MKDSEAIAQRMIASAGHATQSLGVGRVLGQIFAYLYFNRKPRSLNDLTEDLGISKGSASMGVRQLEQWGGLEKIWVKGDRKDYYQARDNFGRVIKNAILDLAGKRIQDSASTLSEVGSELASKKNNGNDLSEDDEFMIEQLGKLKAFQDKTQGLWDGILLKMLLK